MSGYCFSAHKLKNQSIKKGNAKMENYKISPPWVTYHKKLMALFEGDPEIQVEPIIPESDGVYTVNIVVYSHKKYCALAAVLKNEVVFGNVTLKILLYDKENNTVVLDPIELYKVIFKDNEKVDEIREVEDVTGVHHCFVMFKPEVTQFFNDNFYDLNGLWSGLASDIAIEVLAENCPQIHFCTSPVKKF